MTSTGIHTKTLSRLFDEIKELKVNVGQIGRMVENMAGIPPYRPANHGNGARRKKLNIFFELSRSQRKPYRVHFSGAISAAMNLSDMRMAILLVQALNLQDRSEGSVSTPDIVSAITKTYQMLKPAHPATDTRQAIRSGLYRFQYDFTKDILASKPEVSIHYNQKRNRLELSEDVSIEVQTRDPAIRKIIDVIASNSPLGRARKRGALYVEGGPEGFDRLFLELFDHSSVVRETSMYFKPSIITYPYDLLRFIGASEEDIQRKRIAFEGLRNGRCSFVEILNRGTLHDMIRYVSAKEGYKLYPRNVVDRHIESHVHAMIEMVEEFRHYQLVLTDAPLPFLLSTFQIEHDDDTEFFIVFFQQLIREHDPDVNCFLLCNADIFRSIKENIVSWVMRHSTTTKNREAVLQELYTMAEEFRKYGPIQG